MRIFFCLRVKKPQLTQRPMPVVSLLNQLSIVQIIGFCFFAGRKSLRFIRAQSRSGRKSVARRKSHLMPCSKTYLKRKLDWILLVLITLSFLFFTKLEQSRSIFDNKMRKKNKVKLDGNWEIFHSEAIDDASTRFVWKLIKRICRSV